jgi:beta-glucosidase
MTLEQKIAQLHGAMETIDIYAITAQAAESGADMDQLAAQIRVERHVTAIEELGNPPLPDHQRPGGGRHGRRYAEPARHVAADDHRPGSRLRPRPGTLLRRHHRFGDSDAGPARPGGPGVCLHRTPIAGRNFEYFSEDPYLSGVMGVAVTKAIQAHDVIAMAKHDVVNDQEYERFRTSVEVDEHVLRELYLLPFEMHQLTQNRQA